MSRSVFCAISYIKIRFESAQENLKGKGYNFNIKSKHGCSWHGVTMKSKWGGGLNEAESLRAEVSHNGHGVNFNNKNHLWHTSGVDESNLKCTNFVAGSW